MNESVRLVKRAVHGPLRDKSVDYAIVTTDRAAVSRAAKRVFDIIAASAGLILLSPSFLLVSLAIKIDSRGPVFRQQRLCSYNNRNISRLKFRTTAVSGTEKDDALSVTRIGRVLRRTGIDGLPQLINVLRGEMSIVGPSPYVAATYNIFAEQISLIQQLRRMKPGITSWAQVSGCCGEGNNVTRQRIACDLHYIEHWSLLFDIRVILMTLFSKRTYLD